MGPISRNNIVALTRRIITRLKQKGNLPSMLPSDRLIVRVIDVNLDDVMLSLALICGVGLCCRSQHVFKQVSQFHMIE